MPPVPKIEIDPLLLPQLVGAGVANIVGLAKFATAATTAFVQPLDLLSLNYNCLQAAL